MMHDYGQEDGGYDDMVQSPKDPQIMLPNPNQVVVRQPLQHETPL